MTKAVHLHHMPLNPAVSRDFKVARTIVTGSGHLRTEPPSQCQDSADTCRLENGFVASVVSDGAGSSMRSDLASQFCVNEVIGQFKTLDLTEFNYKPKNHQESQILWNQIAKEAFEKTRQKLEGKALAEEINPRDLYCTLMVIIKTSWGFLTAHVGDGRAGYFDGSPKPLIVPLATYTAGATVFLMNDSWHRAFKTSVVICEDPELLQYYFLSTDGPQTYLMDLQKASENHDAIYSDFLGDEAYYDSNRLFHPFFNGIINTLNEVNTEDERNDRLTQLIEDGRYQLNGEVTYLKTLVRPELDDDKTILFFFK